MANRKEIIDAIKREEQRLANLRQEIDERSKRLSALQDELASLPTEEIADISGDKAGPRAPAQLSNEEKIALFRSLFRGREDVFPRRWENPKTGKSGYSPACANEWEYGLCEKKKAQGGSRRLTCGECPNQAFLPVTDETIAQHLRGRQVIGVYPLLSDETCWFLAADFDKKSWQDDVLAFMETCRDHNVSGAIERSRSGNGAHAWFFFTTPIPAMVARKMGCFLITERRDHLELFEQLLRKFTRNLIVLHGGMKTKKRREALRKLASIPDGEERLILATGRYIGEGFDDPRLDTLFLALPVSWKGTLVQYTGRLHRLHPSKKEVRIYDYADSLVPMLLKMFERRLRGYRAIGYTRDEILHNASYLGEKSEVEYEEEQGL